MTARTLLVRGMLVGVLSGIVAFVVARFLGESPINSAIAFEATHEAPGAGMPEIVSRTVQSTIGLATGITVIGAAVGGLFALVYTVLQGRLGRLGARGTAGSIALTGFVVVYLIPTLKYPANPPSIGSSETIGRRTALYFTAIAICLLTAIAAGLIGKHLAPKLGAWNAVTLVVAGALVVATAALSFLPGVHETPAGFPADVLWRFRLASVAIQATLWATVGLTFGALTDRSFRAMTPSGALAPAPNA